MEITELCHRYSECSVNACPLSEQENFSLEDEQGCPLSAFDIEKIKERYERVKNNKIVVPEPEPTLISERMRDAQGNLFRMTAEQARKVNALIKAECCNYTSGKCKLLADDENSKCPQLMGATVVCAWCREAIIPLNKELEADIFKLKIKASNSSSSHMKICVSCGKRFKSLTGRGKYCPNCVTKNQRKQQAEYNRKRRTKAKNTLV